MVDASNISEVTNQTNIKVVGVGGGGGNTVNRMVAENVKNVEFIAINTDMKDLTRSEADTKIALSDASSRGLGAGGNPEAGLKAAQDHQSDIEEALKGADMVFIAAGEGGGTGTGASPLVAHVARELGALTVAVVTRPFFFEGRSRAKVAEGGIEKLRKEVDAIIVVPNDRLLELANPNITVVEAFRAADSALMSGIEGITNLIYESSYINADFNDIKSILKDSGTALFGIGIAKGEDRAKKAAELAMNSPLLEQTIDGAHGAIVNVAASSQITLPELNAAVSMIQEVVHPDAQVIYGMTLDESLDDDLRVTLIAAGFDNEPTEEPTQLVDATAAPAPQEPAATAPQATSDFAYEAPAAPAPQVPTINPIHLDDHSDDQPAPAPAQQNQPEQRASGDDGIDIPSFLR